jgi:small GTP-binding protein
MHKYSKVDNNININNYVKIILLGESHVGKTSLISAFNGDKFEEDIISTICFSSIKKDITINNIKYIVEIWDTAGQERYRSVNQLFIKGSQIVIFVYDITNKDSFYKLSFWVNYVRDLLSIDVVYGVVGNKMDLFEKYENDKLVDGEEGRNFAEKIGALFTETSCKENPKVFCWFIKELICKFIDNRKETENDWSRISLVSDFHKKKKKNCC